MVFHQSLRPKEDIFLSRSPLNLPRIKIGHNLCRWWLKIGLLYHARFPELLGIKMMFHNGIFYVILSLDINSLWVDFNCQQTLNPHIIYIRGSTQL